MINYLGSIQQGIDKISGGGGEAGGVAHGGRVSSCEPVGRRDAGWRCRAEGEAEGYGRCPVLAVPRTRSIGTMMLLPVPL